MYQLTLEVLVWTERVNEPFKVYVCLNVKLPACSGINKKGH